MSNGHANCIFAVCCPPESEARVKALAEEMAEQVREGAVGSYEDIARWVLKNYDLAPPGSLQAFKDEIARLAREGHVKAEAHNDVD